MITIEELNDILDVAAKEVLGEFLHSKEFSQKVQEKVRLYGEVDASVQGGKASDVPDWFTSSKELEGKQMELNKRTTHMIEIGAPLSTILPVLIDRQLLTPSRKPIPKVPGADYSTFCEYHQQCNHHTDKCRTLKGKVLRLIAEGRVEITKNDISNAHEYNLGKISDTSKASFNTNEYLHGPNNDAIATTTHVLVTEFLKSKEYAQKIKEIN